MTDRFRQNAQKVAAGTFALDEDRAREKLADFQLADRRHYVLELVKAAHLLNASRIDFSVSTSESYAWFDAELPEPLDPEDLAGAIFRPRRDSADEAMRHLAIAYHAVSALRPRSVEIRSKVHDGVRGTAIHFHERLLASFRARLQGDTPEETILSRFCGLSEIPITVNGTRVDKSFRMPPWVREVRQIDDPMATGRIGFAHIYGRQNTEDLSEFQIVYHGVSVGVWKLDLPFFPAAGIVFPKRLSFDLSQTVVLHDRIVDELRQDVIPSSFVRHVLELLKSISPTVLSTVDSSILSLFNAIAQWDQDRRERLPQVASRLNVAVDDLPRHRTYRALAELRELGQRLPIFQDARGYGGERLSIQDSKGRFLRRVAVTALEIPPTLLKRPGDDHRALIWLADSLTDVAGEMEFRWRRRDNIDEWQRRPRIPPQLSPEIFPIQEAFDVGALRVVVGAMEPSLRAQTHSTLRLIIDDRLFRDLVLIPGTVLGYGVLIAGELDTDDAFARVLPTPNLVQAALTVARALPAVCLREATAEEAARFIQATRVDIGLVGALRIHEHRDAIRDALREGTAEALADHPNIPPFIAERLLNPTPTPSPSPRLHPAITPVRPTPVATDPTSSPAPPPPSDRLERLLRRAVYPPLSITFDSVPFSGLVHFPRNRALLVNRDHPLTEAVLASDDPRLFPVLALSILSHRTAGIATGHLTDEAIQRHRAELLRVISDG